MVSHTHARARNRARDSGFDGIRERLTSNAEHSTSNLEGSFCIGRLLATDVGVGCSMLGVGCLLQPGRLHCARRNSAEAYLDKVLDVIVAQRNRLIRQRLTVES